MSLDTLTEVRRIAAFAAGFPRHPDQWNAPHEADAELVRLTPMGGDTFLAATIDCLGNELATGIYKDAYTAGWTLVMASLSDLAAVGAAPLGMLLAVALPPDDAFAARLARGAREALEAGGVPALGGDYNESPVPMLTSCGLGLVNGRPVGRTGLAPGHEVWATGRLGAGNALATLALVGAPGDIWPEERFRPRARVAEGQRLRELAVAMMDTSDGLMSTLDHLARLNGVKLRVDFDLDQLALPDALAAFRAVGLPGWALLAGEAGEYELVVAIAPPQADTLLTIAPDAVRVATVEPGEGLDLDLPDGRRVAYDGAFIRNLSARTGDDWRAYVEAFRSFGAGLGLT